MVETGARSARGFMTVSSKDPDVSASAFHIGLPPFSWTVEAVALPAAKGAPPSRHRGLPRATPVWVANGPAETRT